LIAICEPVIEVVMMPVFDVELGGGIPLDYWIVFRLFFSIVIILINFFIVYPIYHSTRSLMRYDYRSGIITKRIVKK
jgi:hypothetical protein